MAVRFDGASDSLTRTRLAGAKTAMGWFRIAVDRNDYGAFFDLGQDAIVSTDSDGTTLIGYLGGFTYGSTALTVGTWYHVAVTIDSDTNPTMIIYVNGAQVGNTTQVFTLTGTTMYVGSDRYGEWLNGSAAHVKLWSAALTAAEVQQEMNIAVPVRFNNLYGWYPAFGQAGDQGRDYSGGGNDWTANGTLTAEDNPPVSWGGALVFPQFVSGGGGPDPQNVGVGAVEARHGGYAVGYAPGLLSVGAGAVVSRIVGYAPAAAPGALSVNVGAATTSTAAYAPAAQPGALNVGVGQAVARTDGLSITTARALVIGVGAAAATVSGAPVTAQNADTSQSVGAGPATASTAGYAPTAQPGTLSVGVGAATASTAGYAPAAQPGAITVAVGAPTAVTEALPVAAQSGAVTVGVGGARALVEGYTLDTARALTMIVGTADTATEALTVNAASGALVVGVGAAVGTTDGYAPTYSPGAIVGIVGQVQARAVAYVVTPGEPGTAGIVVIGDMAADRAVVSDSAYGAVTIADVMIGQVTINDSTG